MSQLDYFTPEGEDPSKNKEGHLSKKGGLYWSKKWVMLTDDALQYKQKQKAKTIRGSMALEDITVEEIPPDQAGANFVFVVSTPVREFWLRADTREGYTAWLFAIRKHIENVKALPPIPSDPELDILFEALCEELAMPPSQRDKMMILPKERKWALICQNRTLKKGAGPGSVRETPEYFVQLLNESPSKQDVQALRVSLATKPIAWVNRFVELSGTPLLMRRLKTAERSSDIDMAFEYLRAIKSLMNNEAGLNAVFGSDDSLAIIALCVTISHENINADACKLLAVSALVEPDGHSQVQQAFQNLCELKREKSVYQSLVSKLSPQHSDELNIAALVLINTIINVPQDLDTRLDLRQVFIRLGILDVITELKGQENLEQHINLFHSEMQADNLEDQSHGSKKRRDLRDISKVFAALRDRVAGTLMYDEALKVLSILATLPNDQQTGVRCWQMVYDAVDSAKNDFRGYGHDDGRSSDQDVKKLENRLRIADERSAAQSNLIVALKELVAANAGGAGADDDKIRALQAQVTDLAKTAAQLESEEVVSRQSRADEGTRPSVTQLDVVHTRSQSQISVGESSGPAGSTGSPSAGSPGAVAGKTGGPPAPPPPPGPGGGPPPPPPPPGAPRPPPPPGGKGGPPPPPMPGGLVGKKVIKPRVAMKKVNWTKLPPTKITGTVWAEADDEQIKLDLGAIEDLFAAKVIHKAENAVGRDSEAMQAPKVAVKKPKVVTLLDTQRGNNIGILLSRFKLSYQEIKDAIMTLDEDALNVQQTKTLINCVPSSDEAELVANYTGDKAILGKAEKFMLEVMGIPRLGPRLRAMIVKRTFFEHVEHIQPEVKTVREACKQVKQSQRFIKLLEIILAIGNYMNGGTFRGAAYGFKLDSLTKLVDSRAGDRKTTLLQYIAQMVELKFPDLLEISTELEAIPSAARVSFSVLNQQVGEIRKGIELVKGELKLCTKSVTDKFKTVMSDFISDADETFADLNSEIAAMNSTFMEVVTYLGEDPKQCNPEILFGTLQTFLTQFRDARAANEAAKKAELEKKKQEAQQAHLKQLKSALNKPKKKEGSGGGGGGGGGGVMDTLYAQLEGTTSFADRRAEMSERRASSGSVLSLPGGAEFEGGQPAVKD